MIRPPQQRRVAEGQFTKVIYGLINEQKYQDAVRILADELQNFPKNRAALSLIAYCCYYAQDFASAAQYYDQLTKLFPDVEDYKIYHAQSLYKAGMFPEASRASALMDSPQHAQRVLKLQAAIRYEQDELAQAHAFVDQCLPDDPDVLVAHAGLLYKEGKFEEARQKFQESINTIGYQPQLAYNIALCHYRLKQYGFALQRIAEIIERGIREHPELSVGSNTEGIEVRSVGNSQTLQETALVEAFNLKAAIEYIAPNFEQAKEALSDMPPRSEEELDPVTLHNQALMRIDDDPDASFRKLNFLLSQVPCPPETFGNLLLLYAKHQHYNLAADVLAENAHLTYKNLSPELFDFLDAVITQQTSPEEAYRKFDDLASKHTETLRKLTKAVQDARQKTQEELRRAVRDYEDALEKFMPVLMSMARLYWDRENYPQVEKVFRQSAEFCAEHPIWRMNVAHVFFMQEKFKEAIRYYEPFVKKEKHVLSVSAIVLANLCVSYIMTSANEEAEDLMKHIESAEEQQAYEEPGKQSYHLCIVNLVIGTLYCAKGNYEFGISRVIKSLEPYQKKLSTDTWFYAKRCFLGLIETLAKHMIMLKDQVFHDIVTFLDAADQYGKNIPTQFTAPGAVEASLAASNKNVSHEARMVKKMFLKLREW
eukprot:TRINITY_DN3593_c0_g1_i1.p1 TRINITY_DN3593_c0_g1~~TRINITY_DN3593_c0_g1_i1.p1  ORF type:complete len:652 (-),score=155.31 TRINITY_DN3593_c0_g1_i1:214-2169(-)